MESRIIGLGQRATTNRRRQRGQSPVSLKRLVYLHILQRSGANMTEHPWYPPSRGSRESRRVTCLQGPRKASPLETRLVLPDVRTEQLHQNLHDVRRRNHTTRCGGRLVIPNGRSSRSPVPLRSGSLKDPVKEFKYRIRLWLVESLNTNGQGLIDPQRLPSGDGMGAYKWMYPSDTFLACFWVLAVFVPMS